MTAGVVQLRGRDLDLAGVIRVAREGARVELNPEARARVQAAREVVERLAREDPPIYGVTTGLGAGKEVRVSPEDLGEFQRRVLVSRGVAVGPRFGTDVVRAMLLTRANTMATGGSGVQPQILETLVAMLNAGVHPVVPSQGSIGAADLGPLAHLALPLIGLGEAEYRGERLPGGEALRRAGLHPVALGPKDGLALCSSNAASVGHGALVLWDALEVLEAATVASALSLAQVTSLATGRIIKLMSPSFSGLPPYGGSRTGFATLQKTLTGLGAEIRHLANPASLDFLPVSEGVEDHATMAPLAVRTAAEIVGRLRSVVAIEAMTAAQAVDLRGVPQLGRGARAAYEAVRQVVPRLDEDRVIGPEVERVQEMIAAGRFLTAVRAALGP